MAAVDTDREEAATQTFSEKNQAYTCSQTLKHVADAALRCVC